VCVIVCVGVCVMMCVLDVSTVVVSVVVLVLSSVLVYCCCHMGHGFPCFFSFGCTSGRSMG
jgi:glycerol-3-phosphate acyltransferase PlsY